MNPIDLECTVNFWNDAAEGDNKNFKEAIVFEDPINIESLSKYINKEANILDFGCGYGRITNVLYKSVYS